jgi:RHS repeat-associated protein
MGLVVAPIAYVASPAGATSLGNVLILSTSVTGGTSSAEAAAVTADGYTPVVDTGTTWDSLTQSQFSSYSAVILGDPTCSTSASSSVGAAVSDVSTWSPAITGNVVIAGASPVAAAGGANPQGASTVTKDAVAYALASGSGKTGLYVSLSCYYAGSGSGTSVPVLGGLGTFTVGGGVASTDSGTLNVPVEDGAASFRGLTNAGLLGWSASVQETFGSWPTTFQPLAVDNSATPSDFTGTDGLTGRPYILVNNASTPSSFAGAVGGVIPTAATYGGSDAASPGVSDGTTTAGNGVNPENGDFTTTTKDASAATYGPALALTRTYDAKLAQAESVAGTPGAFGYGWSTNYGATLKLNSSVPGDIYTSQTGLSGPQAETFDSAGNLYIVDSGHNRIVEVPATSHTQWGISMTAGTQYIIAGSSSGTSGSSGDGGAATSALLNGPTDVALDSSGDLYITDSYNHRVQEVAASTGTQWGVSMTANDVYTVIGVGYAGCAANGTAGTSSAIDDPDGIAVDSSGDLYVSGQLNHRVIELPKASGTNWGISMTADKIYTVAGQAGCSSGSSGNGGVATSAYLNSPHEVRLDSAGDLIISDAGNNRIQEVAAATGSQWGISMTTNDVYTIAGSATGSSGTSGDGGAATSALLNTPFGATTDAAGDLIITDSYNNRIQEVPKTSRVQWATSLTANDIYTVAGASCGCGGSSGDGGVATSARLQDPEGLAVDSAGNLFISDTTNNPVREVIANAPATTWPLSPTPSAITVNQGNGAQVTFIPPVSGACPSPYVGPGTTGTYCAPPYVTATLSYNSGTSTYTLTDHPYATSTFSSTGQLTGESTVGGAALTMTYGTPSPGTGNCPSAAASCNTVTSASGRALTIGLNSSSLVTSVTDPLGNKWTYAYSSGNLTTVTDPMSRVTSYSYDTSNSNPTLVHDLLTLTQPNGQSGGSHAGAKLINTYNGSGQVTTQVDPSGWSTGFNYGSMNTVLGNGDTVVTDPDGNQNEYLYSTGVLDAKVVGYGSSVPSDTYYTLSTSTLLPSSMIDPDGGVTSMTYDASGNVLTSTDQLGRETTNSYNSFDEPTCATKAMATSVCSSLSPPSAVSPGGTISPPSSTPAPYVTYTLYDTSGNRLWQTQGVYAPGATSTTLVRTAYDLYSGNSVTLSGTTDSCAFTPPSTTLPCITIDANQTVTQKGYQTNGDLYWSSTPDGNPSGELAKTTTTYDADGNLTSETTPNGAVSGANWSNYTTTTTFDADHEPLVVDLGGGTGSTVTPTITATYYDPDGNKVATTGALGNPYSASNLTGCNPITTSTCADTTYNTFNADNQETLTQDPSGDKTLSCYDGDGNVAQSVPPWGVATDSLTPSSCPTSYPSGYSSTALATDATMTTFNAQGKPTVVTAPPSTGGSSRVTTTNTYDPASQQIESSAPPSGGTGGSNQVTTTTYDLAGQTTTMTTGFGTSASATSSACYDPDGEQTATVPGTGNSSGVVACGTTSPWTTSSTYQSTSSYDSVGEVVGTVAPPPAGQTANATTSTSYDANGNVITSTDANLVVTTNTYNPLDKLISSSVSGGSSNSTNYYDANGNVVATTTADGNPYSSSDPTGCNPVTTSTCTYTTYNTYNSSNELTASAAPNGQTTTYWYDLHGNKLAMTGPAGNPVTCNPTTSTTPCADSVTYVYNTLNQLTCMGQVNSANNTCASPGSGAGITTYTYTQDGQRATMVDGTGTTHYYYDSSDRLTSVTNGAGAAVTYAYGQNSDTTCISYPNSSGNTCTSPGSGSGIVNYAYNTANQLTSMTDWAGNTLAYSYNASGSMSNLSANSGAVTIATGYDSANNISSIDATAGSSTLLDLTYTRQANGYIASEVPQVGTTIMGTKSYTYNSLNRVASGPITGTTGSTAYNYSAGGNMTQATNNYASAQYNQLGELCWTSTTSSTNACASPPTGATTYSWTNGQRVSTATSSTNQTYGWNSAMDTLTCANTSGTTCSTTSPTSTTSVYTYNSDGLRATSALNGNTNNYVWDTSTNTPRALSDGTWDYLYLPGSNVPIEQVATSGSSPAADLLLADANSDLRGIVQLTSGTHRNQLVNYTDYDAYGNPITQAGGTTEAGGLTATHTSINSTYVGTTAFGFGGGYTDPTGLVYLVYRYYDPGSGQFMSIDPLVPQPQSYYQYAGDNPINNVDHSGTYWVPTLPQFFQMLAFGLYLFHLASPYLTSWCDWWGECHTDLNRRASGTLSTIYSTYVWLNLPLTVAATIAGAALCSEGGVFASGACGLIVGLYVYDFTWELGRVHSDGVTKCLQWSYGWIQYFSTDNSSTCPN